MMQGINVSPSSSSLELPSFSMGIVDPFGKLKQRVSTFRDFMHHSGHSRKIRSSFGDEEIFYEIKDINENIWNGRACFPDYHSPDDRGCDPFWKHWPGEMDGNFADFVKVGKRDLTSEGPFVSKKRCHRNLPSPTVLDHSVYLLESSFYLCRNAMKARERFNISDLSAPFLGHQTSENDHDLVTSDGTRSPRLGRIWDFTEVTNQPNWHLFASEDARESVSLPVTNQPNWHSFASEDARESVSLLSEESCSSSAVRSEATYNPPSNSMARKSMRRHDKGFSSLVNKYSSKNKHVKETWYKNGNDIQIQPRCDNLNVSGEFTRKSNPSNPVGNVGPKERWLFEDVYASVDINPDFSSLFQNSETKHASPSTKFRTDDPSGEFPVPELHIGAKTLYGQNKRGFPVEYSPPSSPFSEKPVFYKPSNHACSRGSPVFGDIWDRLDEKDLSLKMDRKSPDSLHIDCSLGNMEFLGVSVQESIQTTDCEKFGLQKESCNRNNDLSSEDGMPMEVPDLKDNCSGCQETEDETPEIVATNSPKNAEEASSEVQMTDKFDGSEEGKGCHHDIRSPPAFLIRNRERGDEGSEGRLVTRREQSKCLETIDPSCQVMMLESYVLQLLCVQKVIKEASSALDPDEKKVEMVIEASAGDPDEKKT